MNLPRVLNALADTYFALRIDGFSPADAQRIVTEAARNAVNQLPNRPYPTDIDTRGNDNAEHERDVPEQVADREGP